MRARHVPFLILGVALAATASSGCGSTPTTPAHDGGAKDGSLKDGHAGDGAADAHLVPDLLGVDFAGDDFATPPDLLPPRDLIVPPDTAIQVGGNPKALIGDPCASVADCASSCVYESPFLGGYCSIKVPMCPTAAPDNSCPTGSACVTGIATGDLCMKKCTKNSDCRVGGGYQCCKQTSPTYTGNVCAPAAICP